MLEGGYIKLPRSFLHWEWYTDGNAWRLLLHLLLTANYEDSKWRGIEVKRGSRVTSVAKLSEETGLTVQQTRTALDKLISTNEITKSTTSKYTVITVKNYDAYQQSNKQNDEEITKKQQAEQQEDNKQITTKEESLRKQEEKESKKARKKIYMTDVIDRACAREDVPEEIDMAGMLRAGASVEDVAAAIRAVSHKE